MSLITRRIVLASTLLLCPAALGLVSCTNSSPEAASNLEILTRLIQRLLPLDQVDTDISAEIAQGLIKSSHSDPVLIEALSDALEALRAREWLAQSEADQVKQLGALETESWFFLVSSRVNAMFFEHKKVWSRIGYDGPSLEKGGYKDNGFDNISWLPATSP